MNIRITTLSPVHIGSGHTLTGQQDYVYFSKRKVAALLDHKKVIQLLPNGAASLDLWLSMIDRGESLLPQLRKWKPDLQPADVAQPRGVLEVVGGVPGKRSMLKTMVQSGAGQAILPGSSLKGAIRTAMWRTLLRVKYPNNLQWEDFATKRKKKHWEKDEHTRWSFSDKQAAEKVFGKTANQDLLRGLRVSDASFAQTRFYKVQTLNRYRDRWNWKQDSIRFLEALPPEVSAETSLSLKHLKGIESSSLPKDLSELFKLLRSHTKELLEREINFWVDERLACPVDDYLRVLDQLKLEFASLQDNECIIQVGQGSGYTSMTGGWQSEHLSQDDQEDLGFHLRNHRFFDDPPFPKSRALTTLGLPLGYVRLALI